MESITAARTTVQITYNGHDISRDIEPVLRSCEYTDFGSDQIDDLQVALADPDGRWRAAWSPRRGDSVTSGIVWQEGSVTKRLPCGTFSVDSYGYGFTPDVITIKALAASITTNMRREQKTRCWSNITLRALVSSVSEEHGTSIVFVGEDTPPISKVEQKRESDMQLLTRICNRFGYALKVDSNRLAVYPLGANDRQAPILTIARTGGRLLPGARFAAKSVDAYRACTMSYKHPDHGLITATATDTTITTGQTLQIKEHVGNTAEALRVAQARLQAANRQLEPAEITVVGDVRLASGVVIRLDDFGVYDGNYAVDEARHTVAGGYTTGLKLVRVTA
ncbi:MAG TPA: hypothetical protein VGL77_03695 [Armatimonadota bacterium]|jgi:hypothetical protein